MFLECTATPDPGRAAAAEGDSGAGSPVLLYTTPCRRDTDVELIRTKASSSKLATTYEEQAVLDFVLERFVTSSPSKVEHPRRHAATSFRRCA